VNETNNLDNGDPAPPSGSTRFAPSAPQAGLRPSGDDPYRMAAEALRDFDGYFLAEDPARQDEANAVWNAFVAALGAHT
jgi:hypothetical protein